MMVVVALEIMVLLFVKTVTKCHIRIADGGIDGGTDNDINFYGNIGLESIAVCGVAENGNGKAIY